MARELGVVERVDEEVDVRRRDLMRATERATVLDELADQGDRLVHAQIGDGDAEEQRGRSDHPAGLHVAFGARPVDRVARVAPPRAHNATFHAATFGADSSAL